MSFTSLTVLIAKQLRRVALNKRWNYRFLKGSFVLSENQLAAL